MVYDDLAFCSCFVVTWASVCRRGLSSLPGLLAGVGAGGELVDLGAGQDDAAAGAGDRADGELVSPAVRTNAPRFATPSSDFRSKTNAVCSDGENALLLRNRSVSLSAAPRVRSVLRFMIFRSVGDFL